MKIEIYKSLWGMESAGFESRMRRGESPGCFTAFELESALAKIQAAGYDGVEFSLLDVKGSEQVMMDLLGSFHLKCVVGVYTSWDDYAGPKILRPPSEHLEQFRRQLDAAIAFVPSKINAHSGCDTWEAPQLLEFYKAVVEIEAGYPLEICHETHRGRAFFHPFVCFRVLQSSPQLRLTADWSHWTLVGERFFGENAEEALVLSGCAAQTRHIHARIGSPESPQVNDHQTRCFPHAEETFRRYFQEIWRAQLAAGVDTSTVTPEYGPSPYYAPSATGLAGSEAEDLWALTLRKSQSLRDDFAHWLRSTGTITESATRQRSIASNEIPHIDMEPFWEPASGPVSQRARERVVADMKRACREVGLFTLVGHRVDPVFCKSARDLARAFFQMPLPAKETIAMAADPLSGRGYQRLAENTTYGRKDWHEAIDLYREVVETNPMVQRLALGPGGSESHLRPFLLGKNRWPAGLPGFEDLFERYVKEMLKVGSAVMRIIALGLDLPEDFFDPYTNESFWVLRIIGYPPLQTAPRRDDIGPSCGEHTDYGLLTLVNQDPSEGSLEVQTVTGNWVPVPQVENSFVTNIGDMLQSLTGRYYRATPHRVVHRLNRYRISLPFFFEPNFDARIACIDGFTREADFPSVMYGEYLYGKVSRNFTFDSG